MNDKKASCARCSYKPKGTIKIQSTESIAKGSGIVIIDERKANTNPVVQIKCPKCKNNEAYFWTLQTRSGDESETKFYKCKKCDYTWRKYR